MRNNDLFANDARFPITCPIGARRARRTSNETYLEEQAEAHPLVVAVSLAIVRLAAGVVHARVRDADAHLLLERLLDGVRGVYPAVGV